MTEPDSRPTGARPEATAAEPQPVNKELLDIENYGGISGRILYSTQFPPAEGRKYLNPEEGIIGIPHVDPNIVRNYNFITDELSKGERTEAWTGQTDFKANYEQIWRPRFTNAVKNTDRDNRKAVIKAITGKDAADITEADVDTMIYDKYCRGKSDITAYINDVVNGFTQGNRVNEEEIGDKMEEIQWVASKLFGSKSSEVTVIAAKVEVIVKNQKQETLAKFYTVDRLNDLRPSEETLLYVVYDSFQAPTPKEFKSTIELDDREITLEAGANNYSSKGEDSFYISPNGKVVAVYDGMGGMAAGAEASQIAKAFIAKALEGLPANPSVEQVEQALKEGYANAKQEIIKSETADPRKKGMGTTASAALLYESGGQLNLTTLQMGDSRIYMVDSDDQLRQISADYSLVNRDLAQGKITKEEADRINAELDSFTDGDSLSDEAKKYFFDRHIMAGALDARAPEPMVRSTSIAPDFKYLLATSDGVHDNLTKDEIASIFLSNPNAEEAAKQLVEFARKRAFDRGYRNDRSKPDDITAAVIKASSVESVPVAPPAPEPTPSPAPAPATPPPAPETRPKPGAGEDTLPSGEIITPLTAKGKGNIKRQLRAGLGKRHAEQYVPFGRYIGDLADENLRSLLGDKLKGHGEVEISEDGKSVIIRDVEVENAIPRAPSVKLDITVSNSKVETGELTAEVKGDEPFLAKGNIGEDLKGLTGLIRQYYDELLEGLDSKVGGVLIRNGKLVIGVVPKVPSATEPPPEPAQPRPDLEPISGPETFEEPRSDS